MAGAWSLLVRKARTAAGLRPAEIALLPVSWVMIGASSAIIALFPFRTYSALLGRNVGTNVQVALLPPGRFARAQAIGRTVSIAAKYAPFRSNCLPQAMAAAMLCRWAGVPCSAYLGARVSDPKQPGRMDAHAWTQSGPFTLTGGRGSFQEFGIVSCFVSRGI